MLIHQARFKPVPGTLFHHYTASIIHQWIGKRKKEGEKGRSKDSVKPCPISSIHLLNLQAIILTPRAENSYFYLRTVSSTGQTSVIVSKSGFCLEAFKTIFHFSRQLFREKQKKSLNQVYINSYCIFIFMWSYCFTNLFSSVLTAPELYLLTDSCAGDSFDQLQSRLFHFGTRMSFVINPNSLCLSEIRDFIRALRQDKGLTTAVIKANSQYLKFS